MHRKRMTGVLVLAGLLGFGSSLADAKGLPRFGVSVYSNFCISPMSDDLYGARITLRRMPNGDNMLVYEYNDGSDHALFARALALDEKSGTLRFELHDPAGLDASVAGQFSRDGSSLMLRGMLFEEPTRVIALKRVTDFASPVGKCLGKRD
ncbi:MAG: hypothetical protein JWQ01_2485 [Massilia sp.]|jgi:hypothetical protein|nr:hypothetical protein [Massilia sp.]